MIDYQRIFHTGIRVADIEAAMNELGKTLGVTWAEVRDVAAMPLWTPTTGSMAVPVRFVYSREGPQHLELLESPEGSPWHAGDQPGVHHVGLWVDDIAREVAEALGRGWDVALAHLPPDEGFGNFVYLRPPNGSLIEVLNDDLRPAFEEWWSGPAS